MKKILHFSTLSTLFVGSLFAQTSALAPIPRQQPLSNFGTILPGGCIYVYVAGGTTPKNTYSNSILTSANPNPIVLDAFGRAPAIYWDGTAIKMVLANKSLGVCPGTPGTTIWSQDNISDSGIALKAALAAAAGSGLIGYQHASSSTVTTVLAGSQRSR